MFLAAAFAAAGSVDASPSVWGGALVMLAGTWWSLRDMNASGWTPVSIAVWAYAVWLIATNAMANPSYTAAAPFHAAFLAGGFAVGRRMHPVLRDRAALWLVAGATGLAIWALCQLASGEVSRGHAHFETPSTLAAVLNLVLAPTLALLAWNPRSARLMLLAALLAAGLAATSSRGGLLALAGGLLVAAFLARRQGMPFEWRGALGVACALTLGGVAAELMPLVPRVLPWLASWLPLDTGYSSAAATHALFGQASQSSSMSRLELYALALSALEGRFGFGIGYLGFNAVLEAGRLAVPSYGTDAVTYFAHNDYLQTLVELGVPGLAALSAMLLLPFMRSLRKGGLGASEPRIAIVALAALATMGAHAVVDFPFYVPVCLLLFGLALGALDRLLWPTVARRMRWQSLAAVVAATVLLLPPVVAEAAAGYAHRRWQAADGRAAAYWFEVARRIERRDWRYHWYAGQFWLAQAALNAHPVAVREADAAFAAGFAVNPREPRNLLGRIETQRRFGALLASPASAGTLRGWMEQAVTLAPLNAQVRSEQAALLEHARRLAGGEAK